MKFLQPLVFLVCTLTALAAAAPVDADHAPACHGNHHEGHHSRDVAATDEEEHCKHHHNREVSGEEDYRGHSAGYHDRHDGYHHGY